MSANHWHKRYHSDALTGFMSLSLEERGAFQTILDLIYDRGGPIINNDRLLAGYMGVSVRKWNSLRDSLISKGKITICDGHIVNDRAVFELEKAVKTSRKLAENGMKAKDKFRENQKKAKEISENEEQGLEVGLSLSRSQKLEEAKASTENDPEVEFGLVADAARLAGVSSPNQGTIVQQSLLIRKWVKAGASADLIRQTIAGIMAKGITPRTLAYFTPAIEDAITATAPKAKMDASAEMILSRLKVGA